MKKLFMILAAAATIGAASLTTACEGPMGPVGPPGQNGRDGRDGDLQSVSFPITIYANDWRWDAEHGNYFYVFDNISELTPYVMEYGFYHTYYSWVDRDNQLVQETLPTTVYNMENDGYQWEYTTTCDYSPYTIVFYVRYSDFERGELPATMDFRFVAVW